MLDKVFECLSTEIEVLSTKIWAKYSRYVPITLLSPFPIFLLKIVLHLLFYQYLTCYFLLYLLLSQPMITQSCNHQLEIV
ncbi:unnamed protein product [Hymenolepis diminuta]|uniref:Uncharacterized protein n=1 Tax=Hymenolepis diminuta TaxID=6216 RepID=A0A564Z7K9_HYMDI|nr:unnamed protein product [Hymenolepis diminuta]